MLPRPIQEDTSHNKIFRVFIISISDRMKLQNLMINIIINDMSTELFSNLESCAWHSLARG